MFVVPIETEPAFSPGDPQLLFEEPYVHFSPRGYDVATDGRFLMIREENREESDFVLVEGWISSLAASTGPGASTFSPNTEAN